MNVNIHGLSSIFEITTRHLKFMTVNQRVTGSSPVRGAKVDKGLRCTQPFLVSAKYKQKYKQTQRYLSLFA